MESGQNVSSNSVNDGLALAALMQPRGYAEGYDPTWKGIVGGGVCDLREAVKDAACEIRADVHGVKADIRESIQNAQIQNVQQFAHVHEKACDAEKEAIKAQYEGKLQTIQTGKEVENRVTDAERMLGEKLTGFERNVAERFCDVEKLVLTESATVREKIAECCCETKQLFGDLERRTNEQFCKLSEQHLRQTLQETKDELTEARFNAVLAKIGNGNGPGNSDK